MMYGLFLFVFRIASRREMNKEMTCPAIAHALRNIFPEMDSIPHADTIARLLERIDVAKIEAIHIHDIQIALAVFKANEKLGLPIISDLHENRPERDSGYHCGLSRPTQHRYIRYKGTENDDHE